ncbi:NAD(P)H-binding protein [bacterium]|nr:NAD(P)H-binding protein [bacterium]
MKLKKVLLIGGSGFVGGWIANRLGESGIRVTIPTRRRENARSLILLPMVDMVEANINDAQELAALMQGQDAVINQSPNARSAFAPDN